MNPDQTACREQSDMGPYCLQYRLHKNISRRDEKITVVTGGKKVNNMVLILYAESHFLNMSA